MRRFTLATLAVAVLAFAAPVRAGQILVVCKEAKKVAFFDATTFKQLGTADTGKGPREVAVTPDGRWAFAGDFEDNANTVTKIDIRARKTTEHIKVPRVWGPHDVAVSPDGKTLYITCEKSRAVALMDIATGKFKPGYSSTMKVGHTLAVLPDNSAVYVANVVEDNVTIYNTRDGSVDRHVRVGDAPEGPAARHDGKEVWVPCTGGISEVGVIDTATQKLVQKIACPGVPTRVAFTPDDSLALVTCQASGHLMFIDTATREITGSVLVGQTPWDVVVTPDGKRAFVTNAASNSVSVIDLAKREVIKEFPTPEIPAGIAYVP